jgi:ankyrin repeat protein
MKTEKAQQIMEKFLNSIRRGDFVTFTDLLADDVMFELPRYEHNRIIPYLGIMHGPEEIVMCSEIRLKTTQVLQYEVRSLSVMGNEAWANIYTKAKCTETQALFEIEDAHHFVIRDDGKIESWKVYFDSYLEVSAFKAGIDDRLIAAIWNNDLDKAKQLIDFGANPNARDNKSGLTVLMISAGQANPGLTEILLNAGADVLTADSRAGGTALHKACQGGSVECVRLLVDAGAFIDSVAPTTGHTPLVDALWYKYPDIVEYLLGKGAGLNLKTHYGFSLIEHFNYAMKVNIIGKDKLLEAEKMLKSRQVSDSSQVERQMLMKAVIENDLAVVKRRIAEGAKMDERYPRLNGFNDYHTPLLVACRDGHTEIALELLKAGADVNAVEPTFGAVPLHKATYNGHVEITRILTSQPGVDINYQGSTNGYTPLHDALWHGFGECSRILIESGARLDLRGHDGRLPVNIAIDNFGEDHDLTKMILSRMAAAGIG